MPYGYYQLVRFLALIGFAILSYHAYKKEFFVEMIIYSGLALLFQPLVKIPLGRTIWNFVDIIVAIGLIITLVIEKEEFRRRR